ncbi:uncharacterized protein EDB91DRAFT_1168925 [Suillus paluster]|uniref:uncharacterized protein n=1 Tax=Suillus paluster TaxID=48578 RepID=UPI001B883CD5|nr:uncharacterized protein EDB91DRAFT_1168925 [Suillus paluster]KAG1725263.1 hypothetical protein EDB91DRAFT_1168925 [Suillus paluster]
MLRSLLGFTTKPHGHGDAEKELAEVIDLLSKYPRCLAEIDKSEFKSEYDRLQREMCLYKAGGSTANPRNADIILNDCRALKCKVKKTIDDRTAAAVRAEISAPTGAGDAHRIAPQESKTPSPLAPARDASHIKPSNSNQPPKVETKTSLPTISAKTLTTAKACLEPQPSVLASTNPRDGLPKIGHRIPVQVNLRQAFSQVTSGISYEVDSMVMVGASVRCPTLNIDSPDSTGASTDFDHFSLKALTTSTTAIISHGPQVVQQAPQPARPRRATGRRARQQPGNFMGFVNGAYASHGSIICQNSSVMGATLNVNTRNSSGTGEYFLSSQMSNLVSHCTNGSVSLWYSSHESLINAGE